MPLLVQNRGNHRRGSRRHASPVMAHIRNIDHPPGTRHAQRIGGGPPGLEVIMRAMPPRRPLAHGSRAFGKEFSRGLGIPRAGHHGDGKCEQRTQPAIIELGFTQAEGPRGFQGRHRVGAGIGADGDNMRCTNCPPAECPNNP